MVEDRRRDYRQRARVRIQQERDRNRAASFDYVTSQRGVGPVEVRDKISGGTIKALKVITDLTSERQANNRTVIREAVMLGETSNYSEIMILFDDGSKHHTPVDVAVVNKLTVEDLETIYTADMEQWRLEEDAGLGEQVWEVLADRTPVSYERVR